MLLRHSVGLSTWSLPPLTTASKLFPSSLCISGKHWALFLFCETKLFCLLGLSLEATGVAIFANKHFFPHREMGIISHISVQGVPEKNAVIPAETLKVGLGFFDK